MPHQGEIMQEAIKNSGISITRIVEELGITRPTMYRKFKDEILEASFVKSVGQIIGHDFFADFTINQQSALPFVTQSVRTVVASPVTVKPALATLPDNDLSKHLLQLQTKYIALLEAYNELLLKVYGPK